VHPVVFEHPISGRKSVWLHLGMAGSILEVEQGIDKVTSMSQLRALEDHEMKTMFNRYNRLLNSAEYSHAFEYEAGDMVIIDNLAIAHRASGQAHSAVKAQGLRILHR
jgi:taurine dioxygenase